ncbi:helix-turn-helix domain-containing protein [Amycolatopsis anabasis]|uniref:helix-turn-helix domain-containing protein n=1 Tax=Amycolatopsis anabasis TaxID=1840409 RepID=UPI00131D5AA0|nr:helix-turn-helix transcriptional regulator [Amycolatopsis anabasis]
MSDNELGVFLRTRREAVTPAEVGLPTGPRRRTPGLRRAELATLAGISVDYLTRLEQGRDRHPSAQVLAVLGDALRLSFDERVHLRRLSKAAGGAALCPTVTPPARSVRPAVRAMLDRFGPGPAVLLNRINDVLAYTAGYEKLAGPVGLLDDAETPNLARFVFTDDRARALYPEWDRVADEQVAHLKAESVLPDAHITQLADELTVIAGAAFADRWRAPNLLPRRTGVERWAHPAAGALRLSYETLELPEADAQRMLIYLPADDATSAALDRLAGRHPGALRAVNG